jgi:hypothetical protein
MAAAGSTVLWRLVRAAGASKGPFDSTRQSAGLAQDRDRSHAIILPGGPPYTLAFFANDEMDRVENYDSIDLAIFRANEIKRSLLENEWKEESTG